MAARKEIQALLEKLFDEDEDVVIDAIGKLKDKGDSLSVVPLLELLLSRPSYDIERELLSLFYGLKDKKAIVVFFENLGQSRFRPISAAMLSIVWNGNYDAGNHIAAITGLGLEEDFGTLFEALTVVENLEDAGNEEQLLEAIAACKKFLNDHPIHEKRMLVEEMLNHLLRLDNHSTEAFYDEES
jgi:hypothetical protein